LQQYTDPPSHINAVRRNNFQHLLLEATTISLFSSRQEKDWILQYATTDALYCCSGGSAASAAAVCNNNKNAHSRGQLSAVGNKSVSQQQPSDTDGGGTTLQALQACRRQ
jgi:hypothetical protein